jgi:hypothetical protein
MSTNPIDDLDIENLPPDPESQQEFEIQPELDIPQAIVPVFDDQILDPQIVETYDEFGNILEYKAESAAPLVPIGRTWLFNFSTGEFASAAGGTPRRISNNDTQVIQQWIRRALTTERLTYNIYPQEFGVELTSVLTGALTGPAAIAQVVNTVQEALTYHDRIESVSNVRVTDQNGTIFINADVKLEQGELFSITEPVGGI